MGADGNDSSTFLKSMLQVFFPFHQNFLGNQVGVSHEINQLDHPPSDILETLTKDLVDFLLGLFPAESNVNAFHGDPPMPGDDMKTNGHKKARDQSDKKIGESIKQPRKNKKTVAGR
jgi:hypothetical protein